ncbi:MAG: NCS2 family permease [Spirochaetaceae bacterium]|jgi:AGZA family xanthine/uracil permease-like MFS transporter|nr:NCS2 family permease [Spirochaetaceae bacterium]
MAYKSDVFALAEHGTTIRKEIAAGATTFLTMAYILAVNPGMLGSIGNGMTPGAVFTATALASAIATLLMAFLANLPIALAPGMGLNAFFTYTVVFGMGYSWQTALAAVFVEGIIFVILSIINVREAIIGAIPSTLKKAVAAGIGLFIALIGLENAKIVVSSPATLVTLGAFSNKEALLGIIGLALIAFLYVRKIPGSILAGILITTLIGIPLGVTKFPENWTLVSLPAAPLFFKFDFTELFTFNFFAVLFTFLFVDIFDTIGTLVGVTTQGGLIDKDGFIPRGKQALLSDAIGTLAGAALGTSTVTSYVESAAGVAAGGKTGLTALTAGVLFLAALVLSPLFLLIPGAATAPALIFVGFMMMSSISGINFTDPTEGIPAFITIIAMPFFYSIGDGIAFGIIAYTLLKLVSGKFKDVSVLTYILCVVFIARFCIKG